MKKLFTLLALLAIGSGAFAKSVLVLPPTQGNTLAKKVPSKGVVKGSDNNQFGQDRSASGEHRNNVSRN